MLGGNLLANYGESIAMILFGIGFSNLLLQLTLIKKILGLNIMDTAIYLFLAQKGYIMGRAAPIVVDRERIGALGVELVERPLASRDGNYARHDPDKLAQAVLEIYRQRAVRIFRGERRYILEE